MFFLGVDWADDKHDLCLLDRNGQTLRTSIISNDWNGFQSLQSIVDHFQPLRINIERPNGLVVDWLRQREQAVYVTHPNILASYRPKRSKDDTADAHLLAQLLWMNNSDVHPLTVSSDLVEELKQHLHAYDQMLKHQRRFGNQLIYILKQYYPAALQLFKAPYSRIGLDFLEAYPNPVVARAISSKELRHFLLDHAYCRMDRFDEILQIVKQPSLDACNFQGYVLQLEDILPHLRLIFRSLGLRIK